MNRMINIERKHWEFYVEIPKEEGSFYLALTLFNRLEVGVEKDFDWEDETQGPYRFYFQKLVGGGWGPVRYLKVPFSKVRKV